MKHLLLTTIAAVLVVGTAFADPVPLAEIVLTRGPYLQMGTPTSVTIRWRSNRPVVGRVSYGFVPRQLTDSILETEVTSEHQVTLVNLKPNTRYYYLVGAQEKVLAGNDSDHYFNTPPVTGTLQPVRIWVLGDTGTGSNEAKAVRDAYFRKTGERDTSLILHLGDLAYPDGSDADLQAKFFPVYQTLLRQTFFWPSLGNGDTGLLANPPEDLPYFHVFSLPTQGEAGGIPSKTNRYYSFDYANIHFISLDTMTSDRSPDGAMARWLVQDMKAAQQGWIIAYAHHAPYSKGSHDSDRSYETEMVEFRESILPILEAGGVDLVLAGHSHNYERSMLMDGHYGSSNSLTKAMILDGGDGKCKGDGYYLKPSRGQAPHEGAVYIVAGTGGSARSGTLDHPSMIVSHKRLGSLILEITGNRLKAEFLGVKAPDDQVVLDHFTLIKGQLRLEPPKVLSNGDLVFDLLGVPGDNYLIETSTDLSNWISVKEIDIEFGRVPYQVNISLEDRERFYRARLNWSSNN